ncbi:MAG: hypothetical protein A2008_12350 [Candidatus Wallbacteria bacterium GWC2_49_35]|uniref:Uncharacterized protein n=1 Tax=Candidatus Wallbacteria bacterium GWC2_49_35 TaxID=1817813 RepID=A0A1F7X1U6_9BACT|nr:MAG: hypothetical protein A2008_12350 [Candidatus Wallbacteria bacterium GWC2_49_35]
MSDATGFNRQRRLRAEAEAQARKEAAEKEKAKEAAETKAKLKLDEPDKADEHSKKDTAKKNTQKTAGK